MPNYQTAGSQFNEPAAEQVSQLVWWKNTRFILGVILIVLSFVIGTFGKGLFFIRFHNAFYRYTGLSLWILSWLTTFTGIYLVGRETANMIKQNIRRKITETALETYNITKSIPTKGLKYTKKLHSKGAEKLTKAKRIISSRLRH